MTILPAIDCGKGNSEVSGKLLLSQSQDMTQILNQASDCWLCNV